VKRIRRVFIFAHCDDELFCLPFLLEKHTNNIILYLTTMEISQSEEHVNDVRKLEAIAAGEYLNRFNSVQTLFFEEKVFDGRIHTDFDSKKFDKLESMVLSLEPDEIVTLCHEGGHQDHDSVELISRIIARKNDLILRCCSGYRAAKLIPRFFSLMNPSHPGERIKFDRMKTIVVAIRLILNYRSQVKTWIGLASSLIFRYTFFPFRVVDPPLGIGPPIISNCFYENRGRALHSEVILRLQSFSTNFSINE
jgi:LmbE family N-acetylglucosaminyl deacetylase